MARIFAAELGVDCALSVVQSLTSLNAEDYAGNPALKMPALQTPVGTWFGALNVCRQLARMSTEALAVVWPEALEQALLANAQELVLHAMATEVALIMSGAVASTGTEPAHAIKMRTSLVNSMSWLDANLETALANLPPGRYLSYLEVTLFCLVTHLEFRNLLAIADYENLAEFARYFGERAAARETPYRFDP